jgi:hypothetical protein
MEDKPQYYDQCVTEVQKCKLLSLQMTDSVGIVATLTFNDEQISKILSRFDDIGHEYDGKTRTVLLIKN